MTGLGTLWRTVRHLRWQQIIGRAWFRLSRPSPELGNAPARRSRTGSWIAPPQRSRSLLPGFRLRFLNEEHELPSVGWDSHLIPKLWRYNLHYFDDLNGEYSAEHEELQHILVAKWISENPPAYGTGWEPYPTSLRIVNWVKWFCRGACASDSYLKSLAVQTRWLSRRLEFHLLGNHLWANAKALIFAGLFFEGPEAQKWFSRGVKLLKRELQEQVLEDGGHFERSPMYHAIAFEDLLDLMNLLGALGRDDERSILVKELSAAASRMLTWLRCMTHPNGTYAHFNDCAQGIAPKLEELERYSSALNVRGTPRAQIHARPQSTWLSESGYVRLVRGDASVIFDVAPIGPDYLPGHAHADTLSFEFCLGVQPVVVNGGTSCYGISEQRLRERGTAWHSTVQVAQENSSEVWSGFRVGRRARPFDVRVAESQACGSHDGYRYLPNRPVHRRCLSLRQGELIVEDWISTATSPSTARFILFPGLHLRRSPETNANCGWEVFCNDHVVARIDVQGGRPSIERASYAPAFGVLVNTVCLAVELVNGQARLRWFWDE